MKTTTPSFEKDLKSTVISCNSHRSGKPKIRRKVVKVATAESDWKQKLDEKNNSYVSFKTVFTLYLSSKQYYLQVSGVSSNETQFPRRNKIVKFVDPSGFATILFDESDKRIYYSPIVEELIDYIFESQYLTDFEKNRWELSMIEDSEEQGLTIDTE